MASLGHLLSHLSAGLYPGVIEPLRADLGLGFGAAADLALPSYVAFGLGALPAGWLVAHVKARWLLVGANAAIGISALALASTETQAGLLLGLLGVGLGASIYHPVGYTLLSDSVRARGRAHGLQGVFGNIGVAAAPLVGGSLAYVGSWRLAYAALGVLALAGAAVSAFLPFDERKVAPSSAHQQDLSAGRRERVGLFAVLACSIALAGLAYRGAELLLPKHMGDVLFGGAAAADPKLANLLGTALTAGALLVAAAGQIVGGALADKIPLAVGYLVFHFLSLPMVLGVALLYGPAMPLSAAGAAFFMLGMQPFENGLVARYIPGRWRGLGYGIKFVLTFGIGALAVPLVGWATDDLGGTSAAFLVLAPIAGSVGLVALVLVLLERRLGAPGRGAPAEGEES